MSGDALRSIPIAVTDSGNIGTGLIFKAIGSLR